MLSWRRLCRSLTRVDTTTTVRLTGVAALERLPAPCVGDERTYVDPLGLTPHDVPALVELAERWVAVAQQYATSPPRESWTPLHALRALAELRADVAVPTFLRMLDTLEGADEIVYLEELPPMCQQIGAPAVEPLIDYLHEASHEEYPRIAVAHGLCLVGATDPQTRDRVVQALAEALEPMLGAQPDLNANLIGYLAELDAVEHAGLMERAFDEGVVNPIVVGDWPQVAWELGLGPRPVGRPSVMHRLAEKMFAPRPEEVGPDRMGSAVGKGSKTDKAARKRQKQARKKIRRK